MFVIIASLLLSISLAQSSVFPGSALFERLSHFKDVGIPATTGNLFVQSVIADGICRMYGIQVDGSHYINHPEMASAVINATKNLPDSSEPSHLVLTANKIIPKVCSYVVPEEKEYSCSPKSSKTSSIHIDSITSPMQGWYRALCDYEWAESPQGDPAYQPQQMALTTGFVCSMACDCAGFSAPSAQTLLNFARYPSDVTRALCDILNEDGFDGDLFASASTADDIAKNARGILSEPCGCATTE